MMMMIEKTVLGYLAETIGTVNAYMEVPDGMQSTPDTYLLVEKTGGGMRDYIRTATIAVQSIAPTLYEAAQLNEAVISAMLDIVNHEDVSACGLNSDYNFTDTRLKRYRYQAVFDLTY